MSRKRSSCKGPEVRESLEEDVRAGQCSQSPLKGMESTRSHGENLEKALRHGDVNLSDSPVRGTEASGLGKHSQGQESQELKSKTQPQQCPPLITTQQPNSTWLIKSQAEDLSAQVESLLELDRKPVFGFSHAHGIDLHHPARCLLLLYTAAPSVHDTQWGHPLDLGGSSKASLKSLARKSQHPPLSAGGQEPWTTRDSSVVNKVRSRTTNPDAARVEESLFALQSTLSPGHSKVTRDSRSPTAEVLFSAGDRQHLEAPSLCIVSPVSTLPFLVALQGLVRQKQEQREEVM
ncbi:hypothetical protein MG293_019299 [Ovis ammon polii]|uniref:Uncharacterized protein n=1 Tax=Ovis ammon polii TaxID=230172 RepID=A0AAD4XY59_OVIAM|nr:hypothetical protein MG293_019299 [Ovis ammon polii]